MAEQSTNSPGDRTRLGEAAAGSAPGQTNVRIATVPPWAVAMQQYAAQYAARAQSEAGPSEVDAEGWHQTQTIDYVLVLDGPIELLLDDESVELEAGDLVVQRATNHAWRNHGDAPVRLLAIMTVV